MKALVGTLALLGVFAVGALIGWHVDGLPSWVTGGRVTDWTLYVLMVLVGVSVGGDRGVWQAMRGMGWRLLLFPFFTMVGTAVGVVGVWFALGGMGVFEALAVGAGFGYYSLSSVIISAQYSPLLGAVALLSNIFRELIALLFAPQLVRLAGPYAPIAAAGATSMDTTLPRIVGATSAEFAVVSIYHGLVLSLVVPLAVGWALECVSLFGG